MNSATKTVATRREIDPDSWANSRAVVHRQPAPYRCGLLAVVD